MKPKPQPRNYTDAFVATFMDLDASERRGILNTLAAVHRAQARRENPQLPLADESGEPISPEAE